ncbi:MAG: GNAT family N-acetyltransferase [Oscillospiraceae bacterium]|nr:GNAT family N-acetyltransferase [Oscillospiraceae bacterium]
MMCDLFPEVPYIRGERIVLKGLTQEDAPALREFVGSPHVYRYLPTFLFEKKYDDVQCVIERLYTECLEDSLILGVFVEEGFCGLAEFYGYRAEYKKISLGYRFAERCWGKGIGTETTALMLRYLREHTDIDIITASTMVENIGSDKVLLKNGFSLVVHAAEEDWGFEKPAIVNKWLL